MKASGMAIAAFVIGLVIGAVVSYAAASSMVAPGGQVTVTAGGGLSGTVTIGDIVCLTGDLSAYGQRSKVAVDIAIGDINAWLSNTGYNVQFEVKHEDTATDPATALQKLQTLASQGVQVYVGPMTSAEARNIIAYANTNHLVLISQSSTAEDMALTSDNLFRLVPTDFAQSKAVARVVYQAGFTHAVVVSRHDTWGDGLSKALIERYKTLGGTVVDQITYTPVASGTYDFSPQLTQLKSDYDSAVAANGADKVAIIAVSFDELAVMYQQAKSYSSVLSATWFGTDGTAQSGTVVKSAGDVATQVKSISTIYAPTRGEKYTKFIADMKAKGTDTDAYAFSAYDATWVAALSILAVGKNDGAAVQKALPGVANNYYGVAGWPDLNAAGDRAISDYDVWEVQTMGGTAEWVQIGTWSAASDAYSPVST